MNTIQTSNMPDLVTTNTLRLFKPPSRSLPPAGGVKLKSVIFATDLSPTSMLGLDWAAWLARQGGATLWIVHADQPLGRGEGQLHAGVSGEEDRKRERLRAVVPTDPSVDYEHRLLIGDPADEIVRLALRERADLIVLGTHGRKGLRRLFAGSVAEDVLRRAPCPVFVFPQS